MHIRPLTKESSFRIGNCELRPGDHARFKATKLDRKTGKPVFNGSRPVREFLGGTFIGLTVEEPGRTARAVFLNSNLSSKFFLAYALEDIENLTLIFPAEEAFARARRDATAERPFDIDWFEERTIRDRRDPKEPIEACAIAQYNDTVVFYSKKAELISGTFKYFQFLSPHETA